MRGLDLLPVHGVKIPDQPTGAGSFGTRFNLRRPYDLFVLFNGGHFAIELKQARGPSFSFLDLPEHQEKNLLRAQLCGGQGWLAVNFRWRPSNTWLRSRTKKGLPAHLPTDVAFAAPIDRVVYARTRECYDRLPFEWWEANGTVIPRLMIHRLVCWDPAPVIGTQPLGNMDEVRQVRTPSLWGIREDRAEGLVSETSADLLALVMETCRR